MTQHTILIDMANGQQDELFDQAMWERLKALGTVVRGDGSADAGVRGDADILVSGWGTAPVTASPIEGDRLRFVMHSAGTIRFLVPRSRIENGLRVSQATAGMAQSVAELALSFTMTLLRSLQRVDVAMRQSHDWTSASALGLGRTVAGSTIGVVGAGRVGRLYVELIRALGATVLVYDPFLTEQQAEQLGVQPVALDELMRAVDVVAVHAPVTDSTRGMISAERLAMIRDGGILINTARAEVFDSAALDRELTTGRISAGIDVFDLEKPLSPESPLWELPNVVLTPHIGAATTLSRRTQGEITVSEIERFVRGETLQHEITAASYDRLA